MTRNLVLFPAEVLKAHSEAVTLPLTQENKDLLNDMYAYVKNPDNGAVGLAAPQFGINVRMFVVYHKRSDGSVFNLKMVNPRIIKNTTQVYQVPNGEACLSEPDIRVFVNRCKAVTLLGYDAITNKNVCLRLSGYEAAVVQHELDHLDGVLLHDYL